MKQGMLRSIGAFGVYRPDNLFLYLRIIHLGTLIFLCLLPHVQVLRCMYVWCMYSDTGGQRFNVQCFFYCSIYSFEIRSLNSAALAGH